MTRSGEFPGAEGPGTPLLTDVMSVTPSRCGAF